MISENRFNQIVNNFEKSAPILVIGDVGIDKYTYGEVTRISQEAPVPILNVTKEWFKLGLAANVTDNLQALEIESTVCGVVGEDQYGSVFETLLEDKGLKTWGVVRSDDRPTILKERITTKSQQICRVDYEKKSELQKYTREKLFDRLEELMNDHQSVIVQDYGKGIVTRELISFCIENYKNKGKLLALDSNPNTNPKIYKHVSLLKPNLKEAVYISEQLGCKSESIEEISKVILGELEIDNLVITLGAEGMAFTTAEDSNTLHRIPTMASDVFDVSGAGDTVIAALVSAIGAGASLEEAAWIGNFAAGIVVGKRGTATVNSNELKEFFTKARLRLSLEHD